MQRIAFLDVDGTIIDSLGRIDPTTITAVREARANGHRVFLCTGRAEAEIAPSVREIGFDGIVSAGGGFVTIDGELIIERAMPTALATELLDFLRTEDLPAVLQTFTGTYAESAAVERITAGAIRAHEALAAAGVDVSHAAAAEPTVRDIAEAPDDVRDHIAKVVFVGDDHGAYDRTVAGLGDRFHIVTGSIPFLGSASGEISGPGVNKGTTIELLLPRLGFTREQAIGIGDSPNDLEMFAACGVSAAMGNATDAVKAAASEVTTAVLDGGVHTVFARHGLIP